MSTANVKKNSTFWQSSIRVPSLSSLPESLESGLELLILFSRQSVMDATSHTMFSVVKVEEDVEMAVCSSTYRSDVKQPHMKTPLLPISEISSSQDFMMECLPDIKGSSTVSGVSLTDFGSKKTSKKRKLEKNGSGITGDPGPSSSSVVSSPNASAVSSFSRAKPQSTNVPAVPRSALSRVASKDNPITYVSYLNAFSNSLITHPPMKRSLSKPSSGVSSASEDTLHPPSSLLDFEGSSALKQALPYHVDLDMERCGHVESFCPFSKREGYFFCEKHLLDDKGLPFVPCAFQRLESNPCPYPARLPPGAGGKNRPQRSKEA